MSDLRVAVVGAGAMGWNHLRIYAGLKGVQLVGVVDPDDSKTARAASEFGCAVFPSVAAVAESVDAVSVVTPSSVHAELAEPLLAAGIHCLVEKPLALTVADARLLVDAATSSGAVLLVGHVERFNPAVQQLQHIVANGQEIAALEARRMSALSSRVTDIDVVADLMVHDLDIALELLGERVIDVAARSAGLGSARGSDYVTALLTFESGAIASLTASRITQNKIRTLQLTTESSFLTVDYANQELVVYRQGVPVALPGAQLDPGQYALELRADRIFVRSEEPLLRELRHFVAAARGEEEPLVPGSRAIAVLGLVERIREDVRRCLHGG